MSQKNGRSGEAAEYFVGAQCCLRGWYPGKVQGGAPGLDLTVSKNPNDYAVQLEVKSSTTRIFTIGKIWKGSDGFYVLVRFQRSGEIYYILKPRELRSVVEPGIGYNGKNGVRESKVREYKDAWWRIFEKRKRSPSKYNIVYKESFRKLLPKFKKRNGEYRKGMSFVVHTKAAHRLTKRTMKQRRFSGSK